MDHNKQKGICHKMAIENQVTNIWLLSEEYQLNMLLFGNQVVLLMEPLLLLY